MTLFEAMKTCAFGEILMAQFLTSVTIGAIKATLSRFLDEDDINTLFDSAKAKDITSDMEDNYVKMLNMDVSAFVKTEDDKWQSQNNSTM